jgi:hypothetical protein
LRPARASRASLRDACARALPWLAFTLVLALGLGKLAYPLMEDQSLFLLGARAISRGGTLYRDFWDIKPPGIFLFYLAGGSLFGANEIGIHLFELLWMLLAIPLLLALAGTGISRARLLAAALLFVGSYYVLAGEGMLANAEGLMNPPLLLVLVASHPPGRRRRVGGHRHPSRGGDSRPR